VALLFLAAAALAAAAVSTATSHCRGGGNSVGGERFSDAFLHTVPFVLWFAVLRFPEGPSDRERAVMLENRLASCKELLQVSLIFIHTVSSIADSNRGDAGENMRNVGALGSDVRGRGYRIQ
jgi:hypothetical protein